MARGLASHLARPNERHNSANTGSTSKPDASEPSIRTGDLSVCVDADRKCVEPTMIFTTGTQIIPS